MEVKGNDHRLFEKPVAAAFHRHVTLTLQSAEHGIAAVSKNGVTLSPPYVFHEGETAVLTATPDPGYGLQDWSGSNSSAGNPYSLVMNGDRTTLLVPKLYLETGLS